jgi:hypothetical protein
MRVLALEQPTHERSGLLRISDVHRRSIGIADRHRNSRSRVPDAHCLGVALDERANACGGPAHQWAGWYPAKSTELGRRTSSAWRGVTQSYGVIKI